MKLNWSTVRTGLLCGLFAAAAAAAQEETVGPSLPPAAHALPAPGAADAGAVLQPELAELHWFKDPPAAGAAVRLRLRDSALSAVLDPYRQWEVVALQPDGSLTPVPAQLLLPDGSAEWPLYSVQAAFGPSRTDIESGDSFWPVLLPGDRLPLAKLKLVAVPPEDGVARAKAVDVLRSSEAGKVLRSVASGVVTPSGQPGAQPNWFSLQPEVETAAWVIQVHERLGGSLPADETGSFLQLSKVDAYAAEVLLSVAMPAQGLLQLRVRPITAADTAPPAVGGASAAGETDLAAGAAIPLAGEFVNLRPLTPVEVAAADAAQRVSLDTSLASLPGWLPALGLGLAGAILLLLGLHMLRTAPRAG